jgi:hypothetical protein
MVMAMTKSYERLIGMFNQAADEYRNAREKCETAATEGDYEYNRSKMAETAARITILYDVAEEVFGKPHKSFAAAARKGREEALRRI